jgi:hypothetical protein
MPDVPRPRKIAAQRKLLLTTTDRSLDHEIGVFGVLGDVLADERADNIDLVAFFAGPVQGALGEGGSETLVAQFFGNLSVDELENISSETVLKISDPAVALDLDAPADYFLGRHRRRVN